MRKANIITGCIFSGIALAVLGAAYRLPFTQNGIPGPGMWPLIIALVMLAAGISLTVKNIHCPKEIHAKNITVLSADCMRVYAVMGILTVYLILMCYIGFFVMTTVLLYLLITYFSKNQWYKALGTALVITTTVYSIFKYVLKVPFHFGILF